MGGNVFRDEDHEPATIRIKQTDVKPTVAWLEQLSGLSLMDNMLGSTGKKPFSGDIDLAVDSNKTTKEQLVSRLSQWCASHGLNSAEYIKKTGISVHFRSPICGMPDKGHVQVDFMFVDNLDYSRAIITSDPNSRFSGADRIVVLNSIGKITGHKIDIVRGLISRNDNSVVTTDPTKIAKILLTNRSSAEDLSSVESILATMKHDRNKDAKLEDAKRYFEKKGMSLDIDVQESVTDTDFLSRLRTRIVDLGMTALIESTKPELPSRIPHIEDLVFTEGSLGAKKAIALLRNMLTVQVPVGIKWDGKPAIVIGRANGQFIMTDKAGFKRGLLPTSIDELIDMMKRREGDRSELVSMYASIWGDMEKLLPDSFNGFLMGDLLWSSPPDVVDGAFVFTPNVVQYSVPNDSSLGKRIASSSVGVAFHTFFDQHGKRKEWAGCSNLRQGKVVCVGHKIESNVSSLTSVKLLQQVEGFLSRTENSIDSLLNPTFLRQNKISDFTILLLKYVNSKVREGNLNNVGADFTKWVEQHTTSQKYNRLISYIQENQEGFAAVFRLFTAISQVKQFIIQKLNHQNGEVTATINDVVGHEGFIYDGVKLVDRLVFSKTNFDRNSQNAS